MPQEWLSMPPVGPEPNRILLSMHQGYRARLRWRVLARHQVANMWGIEAVLAVEQAQVRLILVESMMRLTKGYQFVMLCEPWVRLDPVPEIPGQEMVMYHHDHPLVAV